MINWSIQNGIHIDTNIYQGHTCPCIYIARHMQLTERDVKNNLSIDIFQYIDYII